MDLLKFLLPLVMIPILLRIALRVPLRGGTRVGALLTAAGGAVLLLAVCWMAPTEWQLRAVLVANVVLIIGVSLIGAQWLRGRQR